MGSTTSKLTYQVVKGWPQLPEGRSLLDVTDVAVDSRDRVFVLDRGPHPVTIFSRDGSFVGSWGEGIFTSPHGIGIGPDDTVYVVDTIESVIRTFSPEGDLLQVWGTKGQTSDTGFTNWDYRTIARGAPPFNAPTGVAVEPNGYVYVSDGYGNARVHKFGPDGQLLLSFGEPGDGPGQFNIVHAVAVGPDGKVYVADRENGRIQVFTPEGKYLSELGGLWRPDDVAVDENGMVYVAELGERMGRWKWMPPVTEDTPWGRVSIFDATGQLVARRGSKDYSAPEGFYAPHGIGVDSHGDFYVTEIVGAFHKNGLPAGTYTVRKFTRVGQ